MSAALDFDAAMEILRRVHLEGEALPSIAHASGQPTARLAADLVAFLREIERTVTIPARSEGQVYRIGARGSLSEVFELPPGCRLVPREDAL